MKTEKIPTNKYIIWIDQKKAIIGLVDENEKYSHLILKSGIETRVRFPGETTNKVRLTTSKRTKETSEKRKLDQQILHFCSEVISTIKNPVSILILGPANVKNVLQKLIKSKQAYDNVYIKIKAEDKLTIRELRAAAYSYLKIDKPAKRKTKN